MALSPNFNQVEVDLIGIGLNNPTSLQFGPDGRLYVSQQDGLIRSFNLQPIFNQDGTINKFVLNNAGGSDLTTLVQEIPNHNDNGDLNTGVNTRQVTGIVLDEGPNGETVLYVSSSDPRIGGAGAGTDKNLDTNSGIISRLTKTGPGGSWEKVDLVIGLPRSEENHSTNGMDIRTEMVDGQPHQIMYVVSGGFTNRGAPSNNFAWTPEYYYSAAVLRIDLTHLEQIEATEGLKGGTAYVDEYVYALPTLNDPTRTDNAQGQDTATGTTGPADDEAADTFGGNDGRNQAKYDPDGPVQVYSTGYRNAYDIVITEDNNIYTFDNGPNNGWGDVPLEGDGQTPITSSSQVATNYPNINVDTGNDTDKDNLHLVTEGFYAGSPNPVYASGAAAGLYWVDTSSGSPVVTQLTDPSDPSNDPTTLLDDLPEDWDTIAGGFTNPEAGVYLSPGDNPFGNNKGPDGSLVTIPSSTNGIAEYSAGKTAADGGTYPVTDVDGAEVLMAVSFNNNLYFMEIVADGTQAGTNLTDISSVNVGGTPLDVRDVEAFAIGTGEFKDAIFIAQFSGDSISALVPGVPSVTDIDKDDDGVLDDIDPLQYDAVNGTSTPLNPGEILFWDFNPADGTHPGPSGEYNIGMNGWMVNDSWWVDEDGIAPESDPDRFIDPSLTDLNNTIRGGAPGVFQVKSVGSGDLAGTDNDQQDAMQTGFLPAANVDKFTIKVPLFNPFTSDANNGVTFSESAAAGFALGDGTMSNWIGIAVAADDSNGAQVKLTYEENDTSIANLSIAAPELLTAFDDDLVELFLTVDTNTYEVTPSWRYQTQGVWSDVNQLGSSPVQLNSPGPIVEALQGNKSIDEYRTVNPATGEITINPNPVATVQSAPVVTLTSTSPGPQPFTADFPELTIATPNIVIQETSGGTQVTEGGSIDTYSLVLSTQPTSDVIVTLSPNAEVSLDKTELTFTPTNWAKPQLVTITAVDDPLEEGPHTGQIAHQVSTTDADYSLLTVPNLAADVVDNDVPEVLLVETDGFTGVAEGGFTDSYSLELSIQPTSDVTVSLSADAQVTLDKTQVVFTPTNWDTPQQVTITAVDDSDSEGNHTGQIAHQVSTDLNDPNPNYGGVVGPDLEVDIFDNDEPLVLHRINVSGPQLASADGSTPDWSEDTNTNPSPFRIGSGGTNIYTTGSAIDLSHPSLIGSAAPEALFKSERWDPPAAPEMKWELPVNSGSDVTVNLYFAEIYKVLVAPGQRVFDVSVEGAVPTVFDDIDPYAIAGYGGFMLSHTLTVNDGILDLEFLHNIENPMLKGIEILSADPIAPVAPTITTANSVTIPENQTLVLDVNATDANGDTEGNGLTYQPLLGPDAALFTIDANTGVLSFISAPDFENPLDNDGDNVYQLEVIVEDSTGLTDLQTLAVTVSDVNENGTANGAATLEITVNSNNVQISNFGNNSFQITNTGDKTISQVEIDVTNALYPDSVFDPFGVAGDTIAKVLTINTPGGTGIVAPNNDPNDPNNETYIGAGGIAGFEGIQLVFDEAVDGGFNQGETIGFSVDMDPNSIAGATKSTLDSGAVPAWDVGGVSGAELIGSTFTVTFTDGTTATGQLHGANNQGGSKGLASQDSPNFAVSLTVNGLGAGGVGTYSDGGPSVIVNGPAGETARVVLTKGIIQPVNNNFSEPYASQLQAQLDALAASDFPANNAAEFQTVDVVLTGGDQDISSQFDFTQVAVGNPLAVDEAQVPLGFVASVIDPTNNDLPLGPVTDPIYLEFASSNTAPVATDDSVTIDEDSLLTGNVLADNGNGADSDADGDPLTVTEVNGNAADVGSSVTLASGALLTLNSDGTFSYDPNGQFEALNAGETDTDSFTYTIEDGNGGSDTATATVTITGVDDDPPYSPPLDDLFGTAVEISGDRLNPTDAGILAAVGNNVVMATQEGELGDNSFRDRDIFTFTVPDGFVLTGIELQDFVNDNSLLPQGFFGIQLGDQLTVDVETGEPDPGTDGLLGGIIYSIGNVGEDLLDIMALGGEVQPGFELDPFIPALSGDITAWLNQGAGPSTSTLNFIVEPNTPPVAVDDSVTIDEDSLLTGNVLADNGNGADSDADGDPLTVTEVNGNAADVGSSVTLASGALLTLNSDGTFSYDPNGQFEALNAGETATDSFTYTIGDGNGGTDTATATVTITGVDEVPSNTPPVAADDSVTVDEDNALTGNVLADNGNGADSDADGDPLTVTEVNGNAADVGSSVTLASGALLTLNSDGAFSYDPNGQFEALNAGETATDSFTYSISDGNGGTDSATATVDITGVDDALLQVGLYDADSDDLIQSIQDGDNIQSSTLPTQNLTIAAFVLDDTTLPAPVESMKLNLNNGQVMRTENVEPYALFGDINEDYVGGSIPQGSNTIVFELYDQDWASGVLLDTVSVDFTLV